MTTKFTHKIGISALTLLLSVASAHADQIAWDNGSGTTGTGLWNTGANWFNNTSNTDSNTPPALTDDVRFGRFGSLTLGSGTSGFPANAAYTINLESDRTVNSLLLDHAFGGALTIGASNANTLTITAGNITRALNTASNTVFVAPVTLGANAIWTLNGGGETQFNNANISGSAFTLTKRGIGTLRFGNTNNNIAAFILEGGTTRFLNNASLGNGTLQWTSAEANSKLTYIGFAAGGATISKNIAFSTPPGTVREYELSMDDSDRDAVNNDAIGTLVLSGALTGNFVGEFRLKASSQRDVNSFVVISGNTNTYSGSTTRIIAAPPINATTNRVPDSKVILTNTSGSAFGGTNVLLNSATSTGTASVAGAKTRAYLGGTGRFTGSVGIGQNIASDFTAATSAAGAAGSGAGIIAPGGSATSIAGTGTLSTGSVTLNADSSFRVELNGTAPGSFDQLNVTGSVDLGGAALELSGTVAPAPNNSFPILLNDGNDAVVGTFNGLPQGSPVSSGGNSFLISYTGGDGNDVVLTANPASSAIISEFRFRGKTSASDDFVEIYNKLSTPLDISGWKLQTKTNTGTAIETRESIVANGKIIPARGRFLFTGAGYSLGGYGTGDAGLDSATPGSGDATDDSGAALLDNSGAVQDAVGFGSSAFKEGSGLGAYPTSNGEYSFVRAFAGTLPKDSGDSSADFGFVVADGVAGTPDTPTLPTSSGTFTGTLAPQLGAPSPQGLGSPTNINGGVTTILFDSGAGANVSPNRVRTGSGNSGTLLIRRTLLNKTGRQLTQIRFSVTRITSLGTPVTLSNQADVRLISSSDNLNVATSAGTKPVFGTTLEAGAAQPGQPLGGALNSSVTFNLGTPLPDGESRSYSFLLDIKKSGNFAVSLNNEALPAP